MKDNIENESLRLRNPSSKLDGLVKKEFNAVDDLGETAREGIENMKDIAKRWPIEQRSSFEQYATGEISATELVSKLSPLFGSGVRHLIDELQGCSGDPIINDEQMAGERPLDEHITGGTLLADAASCMHINYADMGKGWAAAAEKWATGFADDIENNIVQDHAPAETNYTQNYYGGTLHQKGGNYIHPMAVIYPNVKLGTGNRIEAYTVIHSGVTIGNNNHIGSFSLIGAPAEHKAYWGKGCAGVVIGDNNVITGHVTVDAGTESETMIGDNCWLLKSCHIGHDSMIGNGTTVSCHAVIGGHCIIGDNSNIGLSACIHQNIHVPEGCMVGMLCCVTKKTELKPYRKYVGVPARDAGENKPR